MVFSRYREAEQPWIALLDKLRRKLWRWIANHVPVLFRLLTPRRPRSPRSSRRSWRSQMPTASSSMGSPGMSDRPCPSRTRWASPHVHFKVQKIFEIFVPDWKKHMCKYVGVVFTHTLQKQTKKRLWITYVTWRESFSCSLLFLNIWYVYSIRSSVREHNTPPYRYILLAV